MHLITILFGGFLFLSNCAQQGAFEELIDDKSQEFGGINDLSKNPDGSWTLSWPVASAQDGIYLIYKNDPDSTENEINYETVYDTTTSTSYTTEVLTFSKPTCFVVRVSTESVVSDDNTNKHCTTQESFSFGGIQKLEQSDFGDITIEWQNVPLATPEFKLFRKKSTETEYSELPYLVTSQNLVNLELPKRGDIFCYKVILGNLPEGALEDSENPSLNTIETSPEFCTPENEPINFAGIKRIEYTSVGSEVNIYFEKSPTQDVVEYVIRASTSSKEISGESVIVSRINSADLQDGENKSLVQNLEADVITIFSVHALDAFGREDTNNIHCSLKTGETNVFEDEDSENAVATGVNCN